MSRSKRPFCPDCAGMSRAELEDALHRALAGSQPTHEATPPHNTQTLDLRGSQPTPEVTPGDAGGVASDCPTEGRC